jgi:hypothetical protein
LGFLMVLIVCKPMRSAARGRYRSGLVATALYIIRERVFRRFESNFGVTVVHTLNITLAKTMRNSREDNGKREDVSNKGKVQKNRQWTAQQNWREY